jgi:hypothetical protein
MRLMGSLLRVGQLLRSEDRPIVGSVFCCSTSLSLDYLGCHVRLLWLLVMMNLSPFLPSASEGLPTYALARRRSYRRCESSEGLLQFLSARPDR